MLGLFAPPTSQHLSVHFCFRLIVNYCIKKTALCGSPLTSLSYDLYSVLDNQKAQKHFSGNYIQS